MSEQRVDTATDREGFVIGNRRVTQALWGILTLLFLVEALHELFGLGGSGADRFFNRGVFNVLIWGSGAICLIRAATIERLRKAWALLGFSLISFGIGAVIWSFHYAEIHPEPFPTISDAFWLAYYAFAIAGLVLLARDRIRGFDLQRWIDGVAVALIAATPLVALVLHPMVEEGEH